MELEKQQTELSTETKDYLVKLLRVAKLLKIENIILEKTNVRGTLKEEGVNFIHSKNLPNFEFDSLGISRASVLASRIDLLKDNFSIKIEEKQKNETTKVVFKLVIFNKKTKIDFKCADAEIMFTEDKKPPKAIKDPEFFNFEFDNETLTVLERAHRVIATGEGTNSTLSFIGDKEKGVKCKIADTDGDQLTHKISKVLNTFPECDREKFLFTYKNKIIIPLLKEEARNGNISVNITKRGFMKLNIAGIDVFMAPEL